MPRINATTLLQLLYIILHITVKATEAMNLAKSTTIPLDVGKGQKFTLVGRSRAGDGTSFGIPELKVRKLS